MLSIDLAVGFWVSAGETFGFESMTTSSLPASRGEGFDTPMPVASTGRRFFFFFVRAFFCVPMPF